MKPADIVKLVGMKRLVVLGVLLGIAAIFTAGYFFGLGPMLEDKQNELSSVQGQISSLRGKITSIKAEIKYLEENTPKYNLLLEKGIMNDQDRFEVNRIMENMRSKSGGLDFAYNIGEVSDLKDDNATKIKYALVNRTIKLTKVTSELDTDIFGFFQNINNIFPLFVKVKNFSLRRSSTKLTKDVLDKLTDGEKVGLVEADIEFDWSTLSTKHFQENDPNAAGRRR